LDVLNWKHQPAAVAESDDEQVEIRDVLDCPRAWIPVVDLCSLQCRFNFGIGCNHFMLSHDASPKESPVR
jgi:hypothetical protein